MRKFTHKTSIDHTNKDKEELGKMRGKRRVGFLRQVAFLPFFRQNKQPLLFWPVGQNKRGWSKLFGVSLTCRECQPFM